MRTDPLPDTRPAPAATPRRPRRTLRWLLLLMLTLGGLGYLREQGHVELEAYQTKSEISFSHAPLNLQHVQGASTGRTLIESVDDTWMMFLATSAGTTYPFTIDPRISEIEGTYWTPFYKKGSCSYEFTVDCERLGIRQRGGAGTIELELRGLASVRDFHEEVRAIVKRAVEDWLEELKT